MWTARPWPTQCREGNPISLSVVTAPDELVDLAARLQTNVLCLDTEFVRRTTYYPVLALVQLAAGDQDWLIDAVEIADWRPLIEAMADAEIVMHSASEDLEVLRSNLDWVPARLFDTQVAAAFLGMGASLSYAALVELELGIELEKSQTQSDWLKRPLTPAQLHYAREDVLHLGELHSRLKGRLQDAGKTDWMDDYMTRTLAAAGDILVPEEAYKRVKGADRLNGNQLALLATLASWRERRARELDKPRNWLVRDAEMVKIARQKPTSRGDLDRHIGMSGQSVRRYGDEILARVADHRPADTMATLPEPPDRDGRNLVKTLQERVEDLAGEAQIATRLIANRAELEALIRYRRLGEGRPAMLEDWRASRFAAPLLELIDARG